MAARWPAEAHSRQPGAGEVAERARLHRLLRQLTGPPAAGRLSGTPGAQVAAALIGHQWATLGLEAPDAAGCLRPVQVPALRLEAPASLSVGATAFAHRHDFAEDARHSASGLAEGPLRVLVPGQPLPAAQPAGAVLMLALPPPDLDLATTAAQAAAHGVRGLLVASARTAAFGKSVQLGAGVVPTARLRADVAARRAARAGATTRLRLSIARDALPCHDVVATLPGADRRRALLISAHCEHLGDDPGGPRFPGPSTTPAAWR